MARNGSKTSEGGPGRAPWVAILLVAALCGLLAFVAIELTRGTGRIAAVWIPNALLVAILGRRVRDPIATWAVPAAIANIVANLLVGDSMAQAIGLASANFVEVWLAVTLLRRLGIGGPAASALRRKIGLGVTGLFVVSAILLFAFFYPIYTAQVVPYSFWSAHMWFPSWI